MAQVLPHKESQIILPSAENSNIGTGRVAQVESATPITLADAIERVKKHTGIKTVQVAIGVNKTFDSVVNSFAVCPGSGSSVLKGVAVDLYISGRFGFCWKNNAYHTRVLFPLFFELYFLFLYSPFGKEEKERKKKEKKKTKTNPTKNFHSFTGEMSHHDVLEAVHNDVSVILCNHSNSERGYLTEFKETLAKLLDDNSIEIYLSETDADPLVTY